MSPQQFMMSLNLLMVSECVHTASVCYVYFVYIVDLLAVNSEDDLDTTPVIEQGVFVCACVRVCIVCVYAWSGRHPGLRKIC